MVNSLYPPHGFGGPELYSRRLSEELVRRGHCVAATYNETLYSYKQRRWKTEPRDSISRIMEGVRIYPLTSGMGFVDLYKTYLAGYSGSLSAGLDSVRKLTSPDVVHFQNISVFGWNILRHAGNARTVFTAHDFWSFCQREDFTFFGRYQCSGPSAARCFACGMGSAGDMRPPQLWRWSSAFKEAMDSVDTLTAFSEYATGVLRRTLRRKVIHLPGFVPHPPILSGPNEVGKRYFLFIGILRENKGILRLLEAMESIRPQTNVNLLVAGEGPLKERLKLFIDKNALGDRVTLLGWVDESMKYRLMRNAEALVVPSTWPENAPGVALEALSVGLPIIGSDSPGLSEIVQKVDRNLVYSNSDSNALREVLLGYDRSKYHPDDIRRIFEQHYSPERHLSRYLDLVNSI